MNYMEIYCVYACMRERKTDEHARCPVIRFYTKQLGCFSVCHIAINSIPTGPAIQSLNVLTGPWSVTGAHLLSGNIS